MWVNISIFNDHEFESQRVQWLKIIFEHHEIFKKFRVESIKYEKKIDFQKKTYLKMNNVNNWIKTNKSLIFFENRKYDKNRKNNDEWKLKFELWVEIVDNCIRFINIERSVYICK